MVVVNRFRWFGWFVLCVGVILASYITSSRVAAERKKLADVERAIASTDREIKSLETEFDTRANLAQLQRWNGDTLKLTVPTAQQYVRDEARLADINFDAPSDSAKVQAAALVIPSAPVVPEASESAKVASVATAKPAVVAVVGAKVATAKLAAAKVAAAKTATAKTSTVKAVAVRVADAKSRQAAKVSAPASVRVAVAAVAKSGRRISPTVEKASFKAKSRTVAMLDRKLLSDSTLGALVNGARAERRSR